MTAISNGRRREERWRRSWVAGLATVLWAASATARVAHLGVPTSFEAVAALNAELGNAKKATTPSAPTPAAPTARRRFVVDSYPVRGPMTLAALSPSVRRDFTLNGRIPLEDVFFTNEPGVDDGRVILWPEELLNKAVAAAKRREELLDIGGYWGGANGLYGTVDRHPVRGKRALIIGSQTPWVEAILVANGAFVTTVDYGKPISALPDVFRTLSIEELETLDEPPFDLLVSFSSLEHDGLGRYGDPINPNADLERMRLLQEFVRPGGLFFLGVPVGPDAVLFNACRIYGPIRLPMLLAGWKWIDTTPDARTPPEGPLAYKVRNDWTYQPWLVLQRP